MKGDPVFAVVELARNLGLSAHDLPRFALMLAVGEPTLYQAVAAIEAESGGRLATRYPQGRRTVLDGRPGDGDLDPVPGFGARPISEFTVLAVTPKVEQVRLLAAHNEHRRHPRLTARPERLMGASAAEQYERAARAISAALHRAGYLTRDPLAGLHPPPRPGPTRDAALSDAELLDYARIMLTYSADPVLDALMWTMFRISARRRVELVTARAGSVDTTRGTVQVIAKGGITWEAVVSCAVLAAIRDERERRCTADSMDALFLTRSGRPVSRRHLDTWSHRVHDHAPWAQGHALEVHTLRHTTARLVESRCERNSLRVSVFLGHSLKDRHGTTAVYLKPHDLYAAKREVADATFGPLTRWPQLIENDILREFLDLDRWASV